MPLDPTLGFRASAGWAAALSIAVAACADAHREGPETTTAVQGDLAPAVAVAAPGRIEGATEVIEIGTAMDGVIQAVRVREGDVVEAGEVLADLVCAEHQAARATKSAEHASAVEAQKRVLRGAREEERRAARAAVAAALADRNYADLRYARLERLALGESLVSRDELEQAQRARDVAEARHAAAVEGLRLVEAGPLPEERARAQAEVDGAAERVREAETRVEKCSLRAPTAGTILRVHLAPGEQVSLALPRPVISLADTTRFRVRAEVDERNVGRIRVGQSARIAADALDSDQLLGRVARIEPLMGRKRIRSGDPAEKNDRDVLEVLVDVDGVDRRLVIGLRVTVLFAR